MTTRDMTTTTDIIDCFGYFSGVGLKSVPHAEDADHWLRVLSDVPAGLLHLAADHWIRTPVEDKGGNLRGQKWAPSAGELRSIAFSLEADHRIQTTIKQRGCASCGEVINDQGGIDAPGTGFRTVSQHCYPADDEGSIDWGAEPYRVGSRKVLCDCHLGRWIAHQQSTVEGTPSHLKDWKPTLTAERALAVFRRHDARIYLSGSTDPHLRYRPEDARTGSPFFSRSSPEELHGDTEYARALRHAAYEFLRGNRPAPALDKVTK